MSAEETSPYPGPVDTFVKDNPEATGPATYEEAVARALGKVEDAPAPVEGPVVEEAPAEETPVEEEVSVEEAAPAPKKKVAKRSSAKD